MAHYAILDENNVVMQVISGIDESDNSQDWEQFYGNQFGKTCKRTSYNTFGGKHFSVITQEVSVKNGFRKNYAGIGFIYDETRDAFIPPKLFDSWILNEETCLWESTIDYPDDGKPYTWNENLMQWDLYIPKKIYNSWSWNEEKWEWVPPIPIPNDGKPYIWSEDEQTWDSII